MYLVNLPDQQPAHNRKRRGGERLEIVTRVEEKRARPHAFLLNARSYANNKSARRRYLADQIQTVGELLRRLKAVL